MLTRSRAAFAGLAVVATFALAGCGSDSDGATDAGSGPACTYADDSQSPAKDVEPPPDHAAVTGEVDVELATSVGEVGLDLDADAAPCTVNSFVSLAKQGYFDDTPCHRLTTAEAGIFVLQCGDPTGSGGGGPGYAFDDELSGKETYPAGTLAMANAGADTNGSQFFIVYDDTPLPAKYTVFGTVDDDSLEVVQKVAEAGSDNAFGPGSGHPNTPVDIQSATVDD